MLDLAIRVENLGKRYQVGGPNQRATNFREAVTNAALAPFHRLRRLSGRMSEAETFWALQDVSFETHRGDILGIIGRNGAGKSTLLKILSQITEPTSGRIELKGRVASLLEVGTGFHPELSGRENIYLNAALLGMTRSEIKARFDDIVEFSGVSRFLDTPVKRYSSGMYVRLAFAVAAHIDTEILIIDEVLAVGDMEFQRRCLGKLQAVGRKGRTVLFVTHDLAALKVLCTRAIILDHGRVVENGPVDQLMSKYLATQDIGGGSFSWDPANCPGNDSFQLLGVRVFGHEGSKSNLLCTGQDIFVEMEFNTSQPIRDLVVGFDVTDRTGQVVFRTYHTDPHPDHWPTIETGRNVLRCQVPAGTFNNGTFFIAPRIALHNTEWLVHLDPVIQFDTLLDHGISPTWYSPVAATRPGAIAPILSWERCADQTGIPEPAGQDWLPQEP